MAENDIQSWLQQVKQAGFSDIKIREQLKATGWSEVQMNQVLGESVRTKFFASIGRKPESTQHVNKKKILIIASIVLIALLLGSGVFAYLKGYLPIPFFSRNAETLLLQSLNKLAAAESGEYGLTFQVATETRETGKQPFQFLMTNTESSSAKQNKDQTTRANAAAIRTALVLYSDDNSNTYPNSLDKLVPNYISAIPKQGDGTPFGYTVSSDKKGFTLTFTYLGGDNAGAQTMDETGQVPQTSYGDISVIGEALSPSSIDSIVGEIPSDFNLRGEISYFMSTNTDDPKKSKGTVSINGSYSSSGTTYSLDGEVRYKDGKSYVQIRQFPSLLFVDYSALLNKWIVFDPESDASVSLGFLDAGDISEGLPKKDETEKVENEAVNVIRVAYGQKLITMRLAGTETIDGHPTHRIQITLNPENLPVFVDAYRADANKRGIDLKNAEEILTNLKDANFIQRLKELFNNTTITAWVDQSGSAPRKLELNVVIVPSDEYEKLKDKQVRLIIGATFDHLGEEPNVDVPKETISVDEVERLLTGMTVEEQQFNKQREAIEDIRTALSVYYGYNKKYPNTLNELLQKPVSNTNDVLGSSHYFYSRSTVPTDVYEGKAFSYTSSGDDYTLVYTLRFPQEATGEDSLFGGNISYYKDLYVEGVNTANKSYASIEAKGNKDTDKDGLTDVDEGKYRTSVYDSDTDNDGYSDGEEVRNGYNPLSSL